MQPGAELIKKFHRLPDHARNNIHFKRAYEWLMIPFSLWPVDMIGIAKHLFDGCRSKRKPAAEILELLELLGDPPSIKACASITEHEHSVKKGSYETLIKAQHKFDFKEEILLENPGFLADWKWIKSQFNVRKFQSGTGVIRRRLVSERNFRPPDWDFQWKTEKDRFRNVFDAFCHKWVLYGMEGDKPLLQKLSVNITPYGTMIVIPRYWSFDGHRDMRWRATTKLHYSRGVSKQGLKLSANQKERRKQAEKARVFLCEATQRKLKGESRDDWVIAKLGLRPETDRKQLWRLINFR